MRRMTHLTSPTLMRGAPSSPPAAAGGEEHEARKLARLLLSKETAWEAYS